MTKDRSEVTVVFNTDSMIMASASSTPPPATSAHVFSPSYRPAAKDSTATVTAPRASVRSAPSQTLPITTTTLGAP
jgi:hypothetical protein